MAEKPSKTRQTLPALGHRIRRVRDRLGLSQGAFGKKIGVGKLAVIHYEAGRIVPKPAVLRAIDDLDPEHELAWFFSEDVHTAALVDLSDEERDLLRHLRADVRLSRVVTALRSVWDKHGADSKEWDWLAGNIETFARAPRRAEREARAPAVHKKRGQRSPAG